MTEPLRRRRVRHHLVVDANGPHMVRVVEDNGEVEIG